MFRYIVLLTLMNTACTAGIATVRLLNADKAVRDAREAGADVQAPYQFTLAEHYLSEAVDQSNRSEYRASVDLAKKAEAAAAEAVDSMNGTRRINLENAGEDIDEDDGKGPEEDDGRAKDELDEEEFEQDAEEEAP